MIFSRIIYSAILIGIVTGAVLSCLQIVSLNPIIFAAESYELEGQAVSATSGDDGHSDHSPDHSHSHDAEAWAPADGIERTAYTFLSNVLASTGFAAMLLALMSQFWLSRNRQISGIQGALWGLAGFAALFLAPAIGLPPEIPGVIAAPVEHRQIWWVFAAASVAIGLGIFVFTPAKIKALGLLFLALPYVVGAPHIDGPMFQHPDPAVVDALVYLHQQFVVISGIANLVFWVLLGLGCRLAFNRWLRNVPLPDDYAHA
jgi:cobalt transporter subunit CbtA